MLAFLKGFEDGSISIYQVLGVLPDGSGRLGLPSTRAGCG